MLREGLQKTLVVATVALVVLCGCPMRPNPAYSDDAGLDGRVDGDADDDGEVNPCPAEEIFCGGRCISFYDINNCGVCDRQCESTSGCDCTGDVPQCLFHRGRQCYASCPPDELQCDGQCILPPSDEHCGECGFACDTSAGCSCRAVDGGASFDCMRRLGDEWVSC